MQPCGDVLRSDPPEGEPLTAGKDRRRDLMQLRGRQDEQQMLRRFLDDLQQRIEGRDGQHMHLIDDVHTLFHLAGRINSIVPQVPDIVDTIVGGRIDLQHIHAGARIDGPAGLADIAGVAVMGIQTVDRLGKDLGAAGLARTPRAREQVRMAHMPA